MCPPKVRATSHSLGARSARTTSVTLALRPRLIPSSSRAHPELRRSITLEVCHTRYLRARQEVPTEGEGLCTTAHLKNRCAGRGRTPRESAPAGPRRDPTRSTYLNRGRITPVFCRAHRASTLPEAVAARAPVLRPVVRRGQRIPWVDRRRPPTRSTFCRFANRVSPRPDRGRFAD